MASTQATAHDVAMDLVALIDESPPGRLVGSEETTVEAVEIVPESRSHKLRIRLSDASLWEVAVEQIEEA